MALKSFKELYDLDVSSRCDQREAKDDKGKRIFVPYLNWAKCVELLHENGAEVVYYTPLRGPDGSYLFQSKEVENKDKRKTGCYFVSVEIHIDDLVFTMDMPLMNGSIVVYDDTLNQLRISNCHARAFVKGVAIRTGLGFKLWINDKDTDPAPDDLSSHNIMAIKQRIEQLITAKLQDGADMNDIYNKLNVTKKQFDQTMLAFQNIQYFENKLKQP